MYTIYFLFLLIPAVAAFDRSWRGKSQVIIGAAAIVAVIAGLRVPGVDRDYVSYVDTYFRSLPTITQFFRSGNLLLVEPGIRLIGSLVHGTLRLPIRYVFVATALIAVTIKIRAFRVVAPCLFPLAVVIYLSNYFLLHEMTQIRVGLASGFLLLSIPDILKERPGRFVIKILIALLFHYSAVFFLLAYFLRRRRRYLLPELLAIVFIAQLSLGFIMPWLFGSSAISTTVFARLGAYFIGRLTEGTINFANPLVWFRLGILFMLHGPFRTVSPIREDGLQVFVTNMYAAGTLIFFGLFSAPVLALRLSQLFFVVDPIAIPLLLTRLLRKSEANFAVVATSFAILAGNLFFIRLVGPFFLTI